MDENQTVQKQAAPEADAPGWDEDVIPVEDEPPEEGADAGDADALSGEAESDAPSGEANADAPSGEAEADAPSGKADADASETKPPDATETPSAPEPPKQEPDYKALYEAQQEKANAEKYRAVYNQQLAVSGNEAVARLIARTECGGKDYPLEDTPEAGTPSAPGQTDFRAALEEIRTLYPDATEMPASVMQEFADGKSLTASYAAFRAKQDAETIATLRRENDALKKAEANRKAAPVKSVNNAPPKEENPFYKGFNAEW